MLPHLSHCPCGERILDAFSALSDSVTSYLLLFAPHAIHSPLSGNACPQFRHRGARISLLKSGNGQSAVVHPPPEKKSVGLAELLSTHAEPPLRPPAPPPRSLPWPHVPREAGKGASQTDTREGKEQTTFIASPKLSSTSQPFAQPWANHTQTPETVETTGISRRSLVV